MLARRAHSGTGAFFDRENFFPHVIELVRRFETLYCDTSIMASMYRWRTLKVLRETPEVLERTLHASDFPFPSNAATHWNQLAPGVLLQLASERNLLERDYLLKRALGMPAEVFQRPAELLAAKSQC